MADDTAGPNCGRKLAEHRRIKDSRSQGSRQDDYLRSLLRTEFDFAYQ